MVKGNSERRKQLVILRKNDKNAEVQRKASNNPLLATCTEIRARILSDGIKTTCYINNPESTKLLCNKFLRGECGKKCKFDHSVSLSHTDIREYPLDYLNGLMIKDLRSVDPGDKLVYDRNIRSHRREESSIRFILAGERVTLCSFRSYMIISFQKCMQIMFKDNEN
jgi:hypothetical protein